MPTESSITESIIGYLKTIPRSWTRKNHGGPMGRRGIPDITFIVRGRPYFFEVKRPGGRLSKLQGYEIDKLTLAGAWPYVVESVAEVREILSEYEL